MTSDVLGALAASLLTAAPASVEMPAGAGKTHLLSAAVAAAARRSQRSLVLTHTNAGVDAIRRRLRSFGVPSGMVRVETITSWAFSLVGAYSLLAMIEVTDSPDWSLSDQYVEGATLVAASAAIADVHAGSFEFLFVDEYQDCTLTHHEFISALANAIPRTVIFGDRLQAIFGFAGPLIEWEEHVTPEFPAFEIDFVPQRWKGHNEALGAWLLQIRAHLAEGQHFDVSQHTTVPELRFISDTSPPSIAAVAHGFRDFGESVVLLDKWPKSVAGHASRLGGSYSVMEDISGNFMKQQLVGDSRQNIFGLPAEGDPQLSLWLARFAKECIIGLSGLDSTVLGRLRRNESVFGLGRDGIQSVLDSLEQLRLVPTYSSLASSARVIREVDGLRVYRWEAWTDTLQAIRMSDENGEPVVENLARVRERLRRQGRRSHARIASRTVLVKGLEYDHVVIADLRNFRDPRNLYVALSRARKSVTVIGPSPQILLQNDS